MPKRPARLSKPRLVPLEQYYDEGSSSSASLSHTKSQQRGCLQYEQCMSIGVGFDWVENVFSRIFNCGKASPKDGSTITRTFTRGSRSTKPRNKMGEKHRIGKSLRDIPRPPEISRLSLQGPDSPDLKRSGSLDFLFH